MDVIKVGGIIDDEIFIFYITHILPRLELDSSRKDLDDMHILI